MRSVHRLSIAAVALCAALGSQTANAQYDEDEYDAPPPRRVYRYEEPASRPLPRRAGLNCDAIQPGAFGPRPFSCPLPGPRPLGARCFCDTPLAPFNGPQTLAGHVVP